MACENGLVYYIVGIATLASGMTIFWVGYIDHFAGGLHIGRTGLSFYVHKVCNFIYHITNNIRLFNLDSSQTQTMNQGWPNPHARMPVSSRNC